MAALWPSASTLRRLAIGVGLSSVLILLGLRLFALSPIARSMIEARLAALTVQGQTVELTGLQGDLLGHLNAAELTVSDSDGVWLAAREIDMAWSPLALLTGRLKIDRLELDQIEMTRRPVLSAGGSRQDSGLISRYQIERFAIASLNLSQGVAGPEQAYGLTAALDTRPSNGAAQLDLFPEAGQGDEIAANLAWGNGRLLNGEVRVKGKPSGLIATLLEAPADLPVSADLTASGALTAWRLAASGAVGDETLMSIKASRDAGAFQIEGYLEPSRLGRLASLQARFGERVTFRSALDDDFHLSADLSAATGDARLTGRLIFKWSGVLLDAFELALNNLDASRLSGVPNFSLERLKAKGQLTLSNRTYGFDGEVNIPALAYQGLRLSDLSSQGQVTVSAQRASAKLQFSSSETMTGIERLDALLQNRLTGYADATHDLSAGRLDLASLTVGNGQFDLTAQGTVETSGPINLNGATQIKRMDPVADLTATWRLNGADVSALAVNIDGQAKPTSTDALISDLIGEQARFRMRVQRVPEGVRVETATLSSSVFEASAQGELRGRTAEISGVVTAQDLIAGAAGIDGLQSQFEVSGAFEDLRVQIRAEAEQARIAGQSMQALSLSGAAALADVPSLSLTLTGDYQAAPASVELQAVYRDRNLVLDRVEAGWESLQVNGDGVFVPMEPEASRLSLAISGTAPVLGQIEGALAYSQQVLQADLALRELAYGALSITHAEASLAGNWPQFDGRVDYSGAVPGLGGSKALSGDHGFAVDARDGKIRIDGDLTLQGQDIVFVSPLLVDFKSGTKVSAEMSAFGGRVEMNVDPTGQTTSLVTVSDLSLAAFGPIISRPALIGTLDGQAELRLVDDQLSGAARAAIQHLSRGAPDAPTSDVDLTVNVDSNALTASLQAGDDAQSLDLQATLGAELRHRGSLTSIHLAPGAALPMKLWGGGEIASLWGLAAPADLRLDGVLDLAIDNGAGESFRFSGPIGFEQGRFEDGLSGLHLQNISLAATLDPTGLTLTKAEAQGKRGGRLEASGFYGFDNTGTVALQLDRLDAFSRSDVTASISGMAEIDRRDRLTRVQGDLRINQARVNLSKLPGAGYTMLDVVFADDVNEDAAQESRREAIALNLDLGAERGIFVTGPGIDSEWGLEARITGPAGQPQVIGQANMVRGEADLLNRRFRLSQGRLRFVGDLEETELLLQADRAGGDITTSLTLAGTVLDPEIGLSSDPDLPEDEILARVLFGRSASELQPLQLAQMAGAAAQLAGGNALSLTGQLQAATGLDRLNIGFDDSGSASLSTGKYLAEDVYLEIESGTTGAPGVALEWTPLGNVAVDAEIDPELGPKVAIKWTRDFDQLPGESGSKPPPAPDASDAARDP